MSLPSPISHSPASISFRSFWVSDEYGPYIYRFAANGDLIQTIQPPDAIIPITDGDVDFTGDDDPDTGRSSNQGMSVVSSS